MVFLGFLLVAAALVVAVGVVLDNTGPVHLTLFGETVPGVDDQWQVFLAGAAVALVFIAGAMLTFLGAGRVMRARRDLRYLREEHEESLSTLEMEKRQLQRELARIRQSAAAAQPAAAQPAAPETGVPVAAGAATRPVAAASRQQNPAASPFFHRNE
ncbi:hypothetical protein [Actinomadura sp. NEAU-AAG7]|uniref:hypothetical protein n=1 Tax=Actinomadura sp. NEAU-AAG7 TaxID=2839640 RepID=UPI001BE40B83|nr:hypothetical protein [Actinomadura sp. NEAU-AAG7]MBT2207298.1 hypothetical protein [Actinomadura sp. NEAU-AAG7]